LPPSISTTGLAASARAHADLAWPAFVPALAVPLLFLHVKYQPKTTLGLGSTTVAVALSDLAVLAVLAAAVRSGVRDGWEPLRAARRIWVLGGLFMLLVAAGTLYPLLWQDHYRFLTHLVTAAKFWEYGLLAPALPLLLRRRRDALPLLWAVAAWSAAATGWGLLQYAGLVSELEGKRPLQREPSFVGIHDLAALSGAALTLGLIVLALGPQGRRERVLGWTAGASGAVGLVLSGAVAGAAGLALAAAAAFIFAARRRRLSMPRLGVLTGTVAVAAAGVLLMRSGDVTQFVRTLGIGSKPKPTRDVESYVHRSLLAYIGVRIFLDHPVVGVGWEGSQDAQNYTPYLADAHRRFPEEPAVAFPSPVHSWGVQNAYLQTLTDLGIVGFVVLVALFVSVLATGFRAADRAPPGSWLPLLAGPLWLLVAAGVWNGLGLVAGIPLDALTWLAVGLVAASAAWTDARAV
jgi:hypothetical protein